MGAIETRFDRAQAQQGDDSQVLHYQLYPETETLRVYMTSAFDANSSRRLLNTFQLTAESFNYKKVELQITSPGGEGTAMHICMSALDGMRADFGTQFLGNGISLVASAAANLLAYCDVGHRSAIAGSRLVFHTCRLEYGGPITAAVAHDIAKRLSDADREVLQKLSVHIAPCFFRPGEGAYVFPRQAVTEKTFLNAARRRRIKDREAFVRFLQKALEKVFQLDTPMTVQTAIAFGLCDTEKAHLLKTDNVR